MLTDPIADMLTRIRNANKALHEHATMPSSRMKVEIARLLKEEGYIRDYHVEKGESFDTLVIDLKFGRNRERVISGLKRVSKPGRRVYARKDRLPRVLGGMGVAILSTSSGLVTSRTAQERGIGGRRLAQGRDRLHDLELLTFDKALSFHLAFEIFGGEVAPRWRQARIIHSALPGVCRLRGPPGIRRLPAAPVLPMASSHRYRHAASFWRVRRSAAKTARR